VVLGNGISVDLEKIKRMVDWPRPMTVTRIRNFLGLAGNLRFIKGFTHLSSPLTQKEVTFEWSEACEQRFHELKQMMTATPLLAIPKSGEKFTIYSDALYLGL